MTIAALHPNSPTAFGKQHAKSSIALPLPDFQRSELDSWAPRSSSRSGQSRMNF
jgi:hypothetical protein